MRGGRCEGRGKHGRRGGRRGGEGEERKERGKQVEGYKDAQTQMGRAGAQNRLPM